MQCAWPLPPPCPLADVLGAAVPVVVRVVRLVREGRRSSVPKSSNMPRSYSFTRTQHVVWGE